MVIHLDVEKFCLLVGQQGEEMLLLLGRWEAEVVLTAV